MAIRVLSKDSDTGNLSDEELKIELKKLKENGTTKLQAVKWIYDNSDKGLKDSKEFADYNF